MPSCGGSDSAFEEEPVASEASSGPPLAAEATDASEEACRTASSNGGGSVHEQENGCQRQQPAPVPAAAAAPRVNMQALSHTERYLKLLNSGRLASKEKHLRADNSTLSLSRRSLGPAGEDKDDPMAGPSVYESDIARMRASTVAMDDVHPVKQLRSSSARSNRGRGNSAGGDGGESPRSGRASPTRACDMGPGSASANLLLSMPPGPMYRRLYSPGPGAYTPACGPRGSWDALSTSFGTARQRPPNCCIQESAVSPGPVYLPSKDPLSTSSSPPRFRFSKHAPGSRADASAEMPSNHPHWNPGPGEYEPTVTYTGGSTEPGMDGPRTVFGSAVKLVTPSTNLSGTVFLSNVHSLKENQGVHSPGPAQYSPGSCTVGFNSSNAAAYSLGHKAASYFDVFLDPARQVSPGPVYQTRDMDRKGSRVWGAQPRATFGRGPSRWEPEKNLSATTFITKAHARINQGIHSPGPAIYNTQQPVHITTPLLSSGPADRFYDRFEAGRIQ